VSREQILALVSGLPSRRRYSRLLVMLQAYFDGSTADGEVLILAGYIARADTWLAFTDPWQALLDEDGGRAFKMNRAAKNAKGMRRARRHYELINSLPIIGAGIGIPIADLNDVVTELGLPAEFRNPYYVAWRAMLSLCFSTQHINIRTPVDFVFDDQTERVRIEPAWNYFYSTIPLRIQRLIMSRPTFRRDDDVLPLQAADLIAWWGRRRYVEGTLAQAKLYPDEWRSGPNKDTFALIPKDGLRSALLKDIRTAEAQLRRRATMRLTGLRGSWGRVHFPDEGA
jgi:hypothetical protein